MKNIKKLMTFELGLYEIINNKAKRAGVNFQDYIKYLLIQDFERSLQVEYAKPKLAKNILNSFDEYNKGDFIEIKAGDEKSLDKILSID